MAAVVHDLLRRLYDEAAEGPRSLFILLLPLLFLVLLPLLFLRRFVESTASPGDDRLLSKLPSPPNKLPIIGHLHLMGSFPPISLAALAAKHGPDLMLLRLGTVPTVIASSPRAAEAILRTHDHVFASRPRSMVAEVVIYGQSNSCYSPYGDHFRKVRKVVTVQLQESPGIPPGQGGGGSAEDDADTDLLDMFEAGTDTSYSTLDVAMAELMRKPEAMAKLQAEVRRMVPTKGQEMVTESDLPTMTYLKAVIKETLRLHPAAPLFVPHLSMEACEIDGYTIPSGTRVMVNAWAIGRLSACWDNPHEFIPERFMDGNNDVDLKGKTDFRYVPFGAGRRMCPGIHAAAATLEIMLANLVYRFDWELPAGVRKEDIDMTEVFGLTVHRKDKLLLVPKPAW
ncbi:unnamed protein product [Urochloa decumbens]|uniref:Uncharacterized protein n=1 Tax=Urochloa decumbens TaxID=240449 RepID=A0ABC9BVJ2_9POAL